MLLSATKIQSAEPLYPHRGSHTNHDSVMGPKGIDNRNAAFSVYFRGKWSVETDMDGCYCFLFLISDG